MYMYEDKYDSKVPVRHIHTKPGKQTFPLPEDEEPAGRVDGGNDGDARQVQDENQAGRPRYPQYPIQVSLFRKVVYRHRDSQ